MFYPLIRSLLFCLPPEQAHEFALRLLQGAQQAKVLPLLLRMMGADTAVPTHRAAVIAQPLALMGVNFRNRLGLAAGFDKDGIYTELLAALGFGFIELGTVTPRAQLGNPRPRLFRLRAQQALINRMGFNNHGVDCLMSRLQDRQTDAVIGVNIGKNKDTPLEDAYQDYEYCLRAAYGRADYVVVNISSPNTAGLRALQFGADADALLARLKQCQQALQQQQQRYVPLLVKMSPDMPDAAISPFLACVLANGMDGLIVSNTTLARAEVSGQPGADEQGGLSGAPLKRQARHVLEACHQVLQGRLPIIGVGGIMSGEDAQAKLQAGASLVQIYTGLIYHGPALIREILTSTAR